MPRLPSDILFLVLACLIWLGGLNQAAAQEEDLALPVAEDEMPPEAPALPPPPTILPPPEGEEPRPEEAKKPEPPKPEKKPDPEIDPKVKYLEFGQVDKGWDTRDDNQKRIILTVPIKTLRPIDVNLIGLKIFFYDRASDGKLLNATGKITTLWESDKPDWADGEEVLIASYEVPPTKPGEPQYLGYSLRVTYGKHVQDQRVDPKALENQLPWTAAQTGAP